MYEARYENRAATSRLVRKAVLVVLRRARVGVGMG